MVGWDPSLRSGRFDRLNDPVGRLNDPVGRLNDPVDRLNDPVDRLNDPVGRLNDPSLSLSTRQAAGSTSSGMFLVEMRRWNTQ